MKKTVRIFCMLVAICMLAALAAACGGTAKTQESSAAVSTAAGSAATEEKKLDQVELTILTGGEQPDQPGFMAVADEIAKVTAENINVKIDVQTYAWGDYINRVNTMLAAGQKVDIYLSFTGIFQQDADKKQIIPVDELVEKYGADLKRVIPAEIWSDGSYQGKIYGVPALYPFVAIDCITIRGDLREKYGLPPITDLTGFENYLDAVVKGEKGMVGFSCRDGGRGNDIATYFLNGEYKHFAYGIATFMTLTKINPEIKPYKVESWFASPEVKKVIDWNRKAYTNGWLAKDALTQKDDLLLFTAGKSAAIGGDIYNFNNLAPTMEKNIPGCKLETVMTHDYNNITRTQKINNFAVIASTSKNTDRAMMFLNWTRASQDNYNLLMYGIKGKDWVEVDSKTYDIGSGINPANKPYNPTPWWFKNMTMDLNPKDANPEFVKLYNTILDAKYTTPKLIEFTYNSDAMKTQIAQINTTMLEKFAPVLLGLKSTDADYQDALAALDKAGMAEVIADIQKQVDAWAAENDK